MIQKVNLEGVLLTPDVLADWQETNRIVIQALANWGVLVDPDQVGMEYALWDEPSGFLTISCDVCGYVASLAVPPGKWCWKN